MSESSRSPFAIFLIALRLGLTSFGGPVAHLGFFRAEYVEKRAWLSDAEYADLVALCQFLPGPASSQTGFAIGLHRGGLLGGIFAFLGFTLPSAIAMVAFAYGLAAATDLSAAGWVLGMKAAAVAVVAHALLQMAKSLCPTPRHVGIAFVACAVTLLVADAFVQVVVIAGGAACGMALLPRPTSDEQPPDRGAAPVGAWPRVFALVLFFGLLFALPGWAAAADTPAITAFDSFYRSGSLVFGGGHVVLPLLESEFVGTGAVSRDAFLAGYGAVQAVPGPLFTFASFLGAAAEQRPNGIAGGVLGTVGIFLPSLLLVYGVLPYWARLRQVPLARAALAGTNAAVVGLLLAAFYDPVWTAGIVDARSFLVGLGAYLLLAVWRAPAWAVVLLAALAGVSMM